MLDKQLCNELKQKASTQLQNKHDICTDVIRSARNKSIVSIKSKVSFYKFAEASALNDYQEHSAHQRLNNANRKGNNI